MSTDFLHGVEVLTVEDGLRPIQTTRASVIGVIGTAADADPAKFPLNTPVLIAGKRSEAAALDTTGDRMGTLPDALDAIFDQAGACVVVVRVAEGTSESQTMANIVGGVDAHTGAYKGVHAFLSAESTLGVTPRIHCAPGFTGVRPEDTIVPGQHLANPVVAEMLGIADRLRAVIIADGPDTTDADAIAWAKDFGSKRVYVVDPGVKVMDSDGNIVLQPASARAAGIIAKSDAERGFWWSPSNREVYGIVGTTRSVDFALGDPNARANLLNEKNVATIIRQDGFRLWGNRTLSSDKKWAFLSVVRTADMINDSLLRAHLWAVDRNITKNYIGDVVASVNAYLAHLKSIGAIIGGACWADKELNTPEVIEAGQTYFDFDFTPPAPNERVTFRSRMTNGYYEEVL